MQTEEDWLVWDHLVFMYIISPIHITALISVLTVHVVPHVAITQYGSTVYIGIAMVFVFPLYIRKIQFLLSVSSQFDF